MTSDTWSARRLKCSHFGGSWYRKVPFTIFLQTEIRHHKLKEEATQQKIPKMMAIGHILWFSSRLSHQIDRTGIDGSYCRYRFPNEDVFFEFASSHWCDSLGMDLFLSMMKRVRLPGWGSINPNSRSHKQPENIHFFYTTKGVFYLNLHQPTQRLGF